MDMKQAEKAKKPMSHMDDVSTRPRNTKDRERRTLG